MFQFLSSKYSWNRDVVIDSKEINQPLEQVDFLRFFCLYFCFKCATQPCKQGTVNRVRASFWHFITWLQWLFVSQHCVNHNQFDFFVFLSCFLESDKKNRFFCIYSHQAQICIMVDDWLYYILVTLTILPVYLFFKLIQWMGWELFVYNWQ